MAQHFAQLNALLNTHRRLVTAVIVQTTGSTPRKAATRMVVLPDGTPVGTIGGGAFEDLVIRDGLALFATRQCLLRHYTFHPDEAGRGDAICGGEADVFFEYFEAAPHLLVFGAGHCGKALLQAAALVGYRLSVADDRADLLDEIRAWGRPEVELHPFASNLEVLPETDPDTAVVIMTRNHDFDEQILRRVIRRPAAYLGMIASRTKAAVIRARMEADGFTAEELARVHMPIGLSIHSETPEEIAVSILGELIAVRNAG